MNSIPRIRYDALAGYSRSPQTVLSSEELGWFEESDERVLGVVIRDLEDDDFSSVVLARDRLGRFRAVWVDDFKPTPDEARERLGDLLSLWAAKPDEEYWQDDETGASLNLTIPVSPEDRQHPSFRSLVAQEGYSPARELIAAMQFYYEDADGNFVEQFQTAGFDARIWELYLFATLTEMGYALVRQYPTPDFHCVGLPGEFFVEATTVNPSTNGAIIIEPAPPDDPNEHRLYLQEYMPIKYGSALYSKLQKEYWKLPYVQGHPLVFAIQDFHSLGSMAWTGTPLIEYLFGFRHVWHNDESGRLVVEARKIDKHNWQGKEIPSGFFHLPGAENISAVLANPHGTITKFNRMGYLAGFGSRRLIMLRAGTCYSHDPNSAEPKRFSARVDEPEYAEHWCEGMSVFYNPNAVHPLTFDYFPGAAHHYFNGERVVSYVPKFHPYGSYTLILMPKSSDVVGDQPA
jgi:hypothetical protein